jgi:signal transduction histidine kinase
LPLVLLLASIALIAVAAFQAQDAVRSSKRQAEEALRDYTSFAAWSFRRHLEDELFLAASAVLRPINHGDGLHVSPYIPDAAELAHMLPWDSAGCYCHRAPYPPVQFFAFLLGSDTLKAVRNLHEPLDEGVIVDREPALLHAREGQLADVHVYTGEERAWINDTLSASLRYEFKPTWEYGMVVAERAGAMHFFVYRPMATSAGDTAVYAFELAGASLGRLFGGIIDQSDLLPEALTRDLTNRDIMSVQIHDRRGRLLYRSDSLALPVRLRRQERVPDTYAGLNVAAALKPGMARVLIIGGLPRSRLPMLLALLGVATALALVAVQQLRRAASLTRMRSDFVASVSHELRTPLSQIRLYLDTLRLGRTSSDRDRAWSLENLDREATRLSHLVENVLRFASIGQAREMRVELCDVAAEIRSALAVFEPMARSRRAIVRLDLADGLRAPLGRDAFRIALLNVLDNAVKYGPPEQTITVHAKLDGDTALVIVDDQGSGIPEAERAHIFEPFRRGHDDAARAVGGSGIGLAIVRDVMERHGGHASVSSAPGGGARITLRFPGAVLTESGPSELSAPAREDVAAGRETAR